MKDPVSSLLSLQIRQLERLLATKRINFRDSFMIIFSDYPTRSFIALMLSNPAVEMNEEMIDRLSDERIKL